MKLVKESVRMDRISRGADGQGCATPCSSSAGMGRGSQDIREGHGSISRDSE